ncbi:MAG: DUF3160 domain-containing protein [Candidatus Thorarchaeota archaeon]
MLEGHTVKKKGFAIVVILALLTTGISASLLIFMNQPGGGTPTTTDPPTTEERLWYQMPEIFTVSSPVLHSFSEFNPYSEDINVSSTIYSVAPDLSNVTIHSGLPSLTDVQVESLEQNGFVVVPQNEYDQIYRILDSHYWPSIPSFVTSDAVLHSFHVLYDMSLRVVESLSFWDLLGNLTLSMLNSSYDQYESAPEGRWKDAALRNVAYFSVALKLLNNESIIPVEVEADVAQVLSLIEEHADFSSEWFMNQMEDFTQYVPRGHYTRTDELKRYFNAMIWYGRITLRLIPSGSLPTDDIGRNETAQAVLLTLALDDPLSTLSENVTGTEVWDALYEPICFYVGAADDLTPREYYGTITEIYGEDPSLASLDNTTLLDQLIQRLVEIRLPQILSGWLEPGGQLNQTMGLRFMGQRFVPDSFILGQLVYPHVGTMGNPRTMPSGLDVMTVFGSERAWEYLDDQKEYVNYISQMEKMWQYTENVTAEEWTQNLYWLWLYSLLPILIDPGDGFPLFMQSDAWVDKQLMTALASWTELRHDTILYAKQSYGEFTSAPPSPLGYVEPVPRLYGRLASLCDMMKRGLTARGLLPEAISFRLDMLKELLLDLRGISIKELTGQTLNSSNLGVIHRSGRILELITDLSFDFPELITDADSKMSLVADVHTDPNTMSVLEEAVGNPMFIYAVVEVNGELILTRGGTFSYYEFPHPMADRLTDEAWQDILDAGSEPPMPSWTTSFISIEVEGQVVFFEIGAVPLDSKLRKSYE